MECSLTEGAGQADDAAGREGNSDTRVFGPEGRRRREADRVRLRERVVGVDVVRRQRHDFQRVQRRPAHFQFQFHRLGRVGVDGGDAERAVVDGRRPLHGAQGEGLLVPVATRGSGRGTRRRR